MLTLAKKLLFLSIFVLTFAFPVSAIKAANPLTITNIEVEKIIGTTAVITWNTNVPSYYVVKAGTKSGEYTRTSTGSSSRLSHELELTSLQPETKYYFTILAYTQGGEQVETFEQTFTTKKKIDTTDPEAESNRTLYITNNSAFIFVQADEKVTVSATWWKQETPEKKASRRVGTDKNGMVVFGISRLAPETKYEYQLVLTDKDGNKTTLSKRSFTTADADFVIPALEVTNILPNSPTSEQIKDNEITVTFRTTRPSRCQNTYRRAGGNKITVFNGPATYTSLHSITATDLEPNTDYQFYVHCHDVYGKRYRTGWNSIATTGPGVRGFSTAVSKPFDGKPFELITTADSPKIYAVVGGEKYHIKNPSILLSYGLGSEPVRVVSQTELAQYPNILLVQKQGDATPYFLYLNKNMKKPIRSVAVNQSYVYNRTHTPLVISTTDFESYNNVQLIKTFNSPTVYKIEGELKRPIHSWNVFERNNWEAWQIGEVNQADLDSYITGAPIM